MVSETGCLWLVISAKKIFLRIRALGRVIVQLKFLLHENVYTEGSEKLRRRKGPKEIVGI